ncbi:phage major capsid protein [Clostridium botulinum]|uniref:phage major capsid protein n=1 Tax=Clostridium botulinum TaxID=1491 RepID=UPI000773F547|nr:phage major capsid protein [Clostridium botulinum]NFE96621.1 phage major capsid protein [Clostridium botulinum]NFL40099.1 phage major capsid protein [Clostridium botulinum]NFL67193.1 phage major capsid protein [Clostridium botulinum]NFN09974.1 phage major capsid protein [Clostridium botulinum]NFN26761.1 phage major capsid protein [Clostridium botulinum]
MIKIKLIERRALPPLVEEMNNYISEMNEIVNTAKVETRAINEEETAKFNELKVKVQVIKNTLKAEEEARNYKMSPVGVKTINYRDLNIINPGESLISKEYRSENADIRMGDIVKAMAGKDGGVKAVEYIRSMSSASGSVVIPKELSSTILDMARSQSALFGKIPAVPMDSNNLSIAKLTNDAEAHFVAEGELIPESSTLFEGVNLKGKTMALYVPITEQLLDSSNISDMLMAACSKAIAVAMDKALLYGDGTGANIKGVAAHENINKIDHEESINYNMILKGIKGTKKANIMPTNIVLNTDTATDLSMLTDANGQYITPPKALDDYNMTESNNIADNQVLVYNKDALLVGINRGISVEWGYTNDGFKRMIKALRVYIRCDLGVINEKGISLVTEKTK